MRGAPLQRVASDGMVTVALSARVSVVPLRRFGHPVIASRGCAPYTSAMSADISTHRERLVEIERWLRWSHSLEQHHEKVAAFSPELRQELESSLSAKLTGVKSGGEVAVDPLEFRQLLMDRLMLSPEVAMSWTASFSEHITLRLTTHGEHFYRYSREPHGHGSFLTQKRFDYREAVPAEFNLAPSITTNDAHYRQTVMALDENLVAEGEIAGSADVVFRPVFAAHGEGLLGIGLMDHDGPEHQTVALCRLSELTSKWQFGAVEEMATLKSAGINTDGSCLREG